MSVRSRTSARLLASAALALALESASASAQESRASALLENVSAESALSALTLSELQREQIQELRRREAQRVEALRQAILATEIALRREELSSSFDSARVNALVEREAALRAYLRGTESRLVAEIANLLDPEQRRRFTELRSGAPPSREPAAPSEPEVEV